jgi:DNA-binding MarR family transcriptional regulator
MNKKEVYEKALKTAFLKEILIKQLVEKGILKNIEPLDLKVDDKGKITFTSRILFQTPQGQEAIEKIINYLAEELASKEAELWLKTPTDKKE